MKRVFQFLRMTIAGGIVFLIPIIVAIVILEKALSLTNKVVAPLAAKMGSETIVGLNAARVLAVVIIVLFCFLAGCLARSALARRMVGWLDTAVLSNLPGYEFFKAVGESALGVEQRGNQQVVLARFDDCWQVGFLMDRLDNGLVAVYIPGAPSPHSGSVCFLTADRVIPTDVAATAILKCLKRLGAGTNPVLGQLPTVTPELAIGAASGRH